MARRLGLEEGWDQERERGYKKGVEGDLSMSSSRAPQEILT